MTLFWILLFTLLALALLFTLLPLCRHLSKPSDYIALASLAVLTIALSLGLYLKQGSSAALHQTLVLQARAAHLRSLLGEINHNPQTAINMMKTYLKNKPDDKHAWYLLGKLYQSAGDTREARQAFMRSGGEGTNG